MLAERACTIRPGVRLRSRPEVIDHLGVCGKAGTFRDTEIQVRRPAAGCEDRDKFICG
ncbi:hypothetical protein ABZT27_31435 [Streptomyces sp. NPDC005389]|uniref:hypothetical protein n=1 Tax=Streptomyces sp. NPDC005389 TaxID=3157040 RepID=UPI0033AD2CBB